ncbi:MAG: thiamine diphosphokinase [Chloroflexi bacterium]|nr:thiamine diphosphokinase [Chloroflexota bacterium]MCA2000977.1 thiamine diphosphokinase [Chloroflexota bacterium]
MRVEKLLTDHLTMRIIIFANGNLPNPEKARSLLREDDFIIAADGGARHALALGRVPNVIVGDLDSAEFDLQPLMEKGTKALQFPRDKNETDLELAIQHALTLRPEQVVILAALGGRLDQTLGNIALISRPFLLSPSSLALRLDDGVEEVFFCHDRCEINGAAGDLVSLIPWQGEAAGVVTAGLKWRLRGETLYPHKTRGVSNEMLGETASLQIQSGSLLVVHRRTSL